MACLFYRPSSGPKTCSLFGGGEDSRQVRKPNALLEVRGWGFSGFYSPNYVLSGLLTTVVKFCVWGLGFQFGFCVFLCLVVCELNQYVELFEKYHCVLLC